MYLACARTEDCPEDNVCQDGRCHRKCAAGGTGCDGNLGCIKGGVCGIITCDTCLLGTNCQDGLCEVPVSIFAHSKRDVYPLNAVDDITVSCFRTTIYTLYSSATVVIDTRSFHGSND